MVWRGPGRGLERSWERFGEVLGEVWRGPGRGLERSWERFGGSFGKVGAETNLGIVQHC